MSNAVYAVKESRRELELTSRAKEKRNIFSKWLHEEEVKVER